MSYHNRPQSTRSDDVTENGADPHIGLGGLHVAQGRPLAANWSLRESVALASTDTVGRHRRLDVTAMRHTFVTCELVLVFIITKPSISRNLG